MSNEIKVGDVVRCIDSRGILRGRDETRELEYNCLYRVYALRDSIFPTILLLAITPDKGPGWFSDRFVKVNEVTPLMKLLFPVSSDINDL